MKEMTQANLQAAFAGESQAHVKYMAFADMAEREKLPNVARIFRAAAYAEQMHATNHLRALNGVGKTPANLEAAFGGETFEINEMYPAYLAVADLQAEKRALRSMGDALAAEKVHAALYAAAKEAVAAGKDVVLGAVWVCDVCGFTGEGEPPEKCPICGAVHAKLRTF
ncbi:MAG: rubrerythrin [Chloroflexi bacterium HGW-Chloroflexi-1]|nr:MAG: rubrerythrin [Chloroflexi bacterium HGW-Chloroflexi-1]